LRALEGLVPAALGLKLFEDESSKVVLFAFGQLGGLLKCFFRSRVMTTGRYVRVSLILGR